MKNFIILLITLSVAVTSYCQSNYEKTYSTLSQKLKTNEVSNFKDIVFLIESTFDEHLMRKDYVDKINFLLSIAHKRENSDSLIYQNQDKDRIKKYAAIFKVLTDTTKYIALGKIYNNFPIHYDFDDIFGDKSWENMFVTKLLATQKGNCHSMPYLYKILCEEMGVPCWLALAPNHIYIKHRSEKTGKIGRAHV